MSMRSCIRSDRVLGISLCALLLWAGAAPAAEGDSLKGEVKKIGDAAATSLKLDGKSLMGLFWDGDKGDAFIAVEQLRGAGRDEPEKGVIRRISFPDFKVLREKDLPSAPLGLSPSAKGLVLSLPIDVNKNGVAGKMQVWLLDPKTFEVKSKLDTPNVGGAVSAPGLSIAVWPDPTGGTLSAIDLKSGKTTEYAPIQFTSRYSKEYSGEGPGPLPFRGPTFTPDGKYLFTQAGDGGGQICKFHLDGGKVKFDEVSSPVGPGDPTGIQLSPDSKRVCLPSGTNYVTQIFPTDSLAKSVCKLNYTPGPFAVAFDPADGSIYAVTGEPKLVLFTTKGVKKNEYPLEKRSFGVRQCLIHPDGGKLLVLMNPHPYFIDLPKKP